MIDNYLEKAYEIISLEAAASNKTHEKRNLKALVSLKVHRELTSLCERSDMSMSELLRQIVYKDLEKV